MIMGISRKSASMSAIGSSSPAAATQIERLECGYFDVQQVQQISKALLLTLATACVDRDLFSSPKSMAAELRQELLDYATNECERYSNTTTDPSDEYDHQAPVSVIEGFLENFIRSRKTLLRRVSSKFFRTNSSNIGSTSSDDRIDEMVGELDRSGAWPGSRREALARLLLKRVDRGRRRICCDRVFHSNEDLMTHKLKCRLRPVDCPSLGCDAIFSAARSAEHDCLCLFKLLPCEQKCNLMVMRGEMAMHCASPACEMRPIGCPFRAAGCSRLIPQSQIQRHCEAEIGSHLLSLLQILQKLDSSAESQCQRIVLLEKAVSLAKKVEGVDVGSLTVTVREQEVRIKNLEQEVGKLRQEMKVTDVSAEVLQLRRELRNLQKRVESQVSNPPSSTPLNSPNLKNGVICNR